MTETNGDKRIFCYCHLGRDMRENDQNHVLHSEGERTLGITLASTTTFDEFVARVQRKLGFEASCPKLKYVLEFDKNQMIDIMDEEDYHEMMNISDKYVHVYAFPSEKESTTVHREEQRSQEQIPINYSRFNGDDVQHFDPASSSSVVNNRLFMEKTNLVTSCIDAEQRVISSELWKNEIHGVGQTFHGVIAFRNALYRYSIAHKFDYLFLKNSIRLMRVRCSIEGCPWRVNANQVGKTDFLKVTTFVNEHLHSAQDVLKAKPKVRSKLAAGIISTKLRIQPETTPNDIRAAFASELNMPITYKQGWQLKEQSMRLIHGVPDESYRLIPWLCKKIKEADENAIAEYEASSDHRFVKVFIAYGCSILGFLSGCRPLICIDGCHLSGPYKGTLLSATAFDADNKMFPLAYAVVGSEKYEDWYWFLSKLKEITRSVDVTIMSDRHKNILSSVAEIFGKENHGYCYRHIKENFATEVGKVLPRTKLAKETALNLLDGVMYARLDIDFQNALENLKNFKPELADWVMENQPEHWVVSRFSKRRWDHVTTNVAESFNAWIVKERRHYVFALMNELRDNLALKLLHETEDIRLWKNGVGPNIEKKLLENIVRGQNMIVTPYGECSAKVSTGFADLKVDLAARTCTCFQWQMSGIPCPHACAAIKKLNGNLYDYVEDCYQLPKQLLIYSKLMVPIETHDIPSGTSNVALQNAVDDVEFLSPPTTKRPPGRPRVKRIESQFMKKRKVQCTRCKELGHNRSTCTNPNPS